MEIQTYNAWNKEIIESITDQVCILEIILYSIQSSCPTEH